MKKDKLFESILGASLKESEIDTDARYYVVEHMDDHGYLGDVNFGDGGGEWGFDNEQGEIGDRADMEPMDFYHACHLGGLLAAFGHNSVEAFDVDSIANRDLESVQQDEFASGCEAADMSEDEFIEAIGKAMEACNALENGEEKVSCPGSGYDNLYVYLVKEEPKDFSAEYNA